MGQSGKIMKDVFLFVFPHTIIIHALTIGHWDVHSEYLGEKSHDITLKRFPFPFEVQFGGHYSHPETRPMIRDSMIFVNGFIKFSIAFLLYFFLLRKKKRILLL